MQIKSDGRARQRGKYIFKKENIKKMWIYNYNFTICNKKAIFMLERVYVSMFNIIYGNV